MPGYLALADVEVVLDVLERKLTPDIVKSLMTKAKLGGYLQQCASWVTDFVEAECQDLLTIVLGKDYEGSVTSRSDDGVDLLPTHQPTLERWLQNELGADLAISQLEDAEDAPEMMEWRLDVSATYRKKHGEPLGGLRGRS